MRSWVSARRLRHLRKRKKEAMARRRRKAPIAMPIIAPSGREVEEEDEAEGSRMVMSWEEVGSVGNWAWVR